MSSNRQRNTRHENDRCLLPITELDGFLRTWMNLPQSHSSVSMSKTGVALVLVSVARASILSDKKRRGYRNNEESRQRLFQSLQCSFHKHRRSFFNCASALETCPSNRPTHIISSFTRSPITSTLCAAPFSPARKQPHVL